MQAFQDVLPVRIVKAVHNANCGVNEVLELEMGGNEECARRHEPHHPEPALTFAVVPDGRLVKARTLLETDQATFQPIPRPNSPVRCIRQHVRGGAPLLTIPSP